MNEDGAEDLSFDHLMVEAVLHWPTDIPAQVIYFPTGRYVVAGLGEIADSIAERHTGSPREVLLTNLHDAIFERLHAIAPEGGNLAAHALAQSGVRSVFERRLLSDAERDDLSWRPQDRALVSRYFEQNRERTAA